MGGGGNKKGAPQVKINIIGEQKVPVNKTLYGGSMHKSELSCTIPQSHTTTTLTSARHIDITYVLGVKALMGTGKPLIMELPVIVSNWPRWVFFCVSCRVVVACANESVQICVGRGGQVKSCQSIISLHTAHHLTPPSPSLHSQTNRPRPRTRR